jgi:hypothetical protein
MLWLCAAAVLSMSWTLRRGEVMSSVRAPAVPD